MLFVYIKLSFQDFFELRNIFHTKKKLFVKSVCTYVRFVKNNEDFSYLGGKASN